MFLALTSSFKEFSWHLHRENRSVVLDQMGTDIVHALNLLIPLLNPVHYLFQSNVLCAEQNMYTKVKEREREI